MKICLYNDALTGAVVGDQLYPIGDALINAMSAHTGDMICGLREHIRFLSSIMTLKPGVLITTGTLAGVAKLAPGDRLKGSIERTGEMEVEVRAER